MIIRTSMRGQRTKVPLTTTKAQQPFRNILNETMSVEELQKRLNTLKSTDKLLVTISRASEGTSYPTHVRPSDNDVPSSPACNAKPIASYGKIIPTKSGQKIVGTRKRR